MQVRSFGDIPQDDLDDVVATQAKANVGGLPGALVVFGENLAVTWQRIFLSFQQTEGRTHRCYFATASVAHQTHGTFDGNGKAKPLWRRRPALE